MYKRCVTSIIVDMKIKKHTSNTNCNLLNYNDLGGGGFAVTSSFIYRYRAFRRCQMMAQAEGSLRLFESTSVRLWNSHIS